MSHKGFSHLGLSTRDIAKTRAFYEGVLGFKVVVDDVIPIEEGGRIRHVFFDVGRDQLLAFMQADGVAGVTADYDAGINRGLGVPAAFYHFAFEAGSEQALAAKRDDLRAKGGGGLRRHGPRLGQVDLLQGPERPVPGVLLPAP
jgi:catechol 2,3-dioxygenase-like lactoylglutathione lyase family enzyme